MKTLASGAIVAGSYELSELLGSGGMGEVWAAKHRVTGREVAIKCLRPSAYRDPDALARFQREARAACAVDHPNVVEVLDFAEREGEEPMIIMERLRGETLSEKLAREETLPLAETARLLVQAISAVGTAHARGIVHRDLKPSNIFLLRRPRDAATAVKVLDFGVAKWMTINDGGPSLRTKSGSTLGTPCYMAPEQAIGDRTVDHRADVWAFGVILYECLTGVRPVEGENSAQVIAHLLSTGIIPVEQLAPSLPADVSELIGKMLKRDPLGRPLDLRQALALLSRYTSVVAPAFSEPSAERVAPEDREPVRKAPVVARPFAQQEVETEIPTATDHAPATRPAGQRSLGRFFGLAALAGVLAVLWLARARNASDGVPPAAEPPPPVQPVAAAPTPVPTPVPSATAEGLLPSPAVSSTSMASHVPARKLPKSGVPLLRKSASPEVPPAASGASPSTTSVTTATGLRTGESCEKSSDCESKKCVAFACQ